MQQVGNLVVNEYDSLQLLRRFERPQDLLPNLRKLIRIIGPMVQFLGLAVISTRSVTPDFLRSFRISRWAGHLWEAGVHAVQFERQCSRFAAIAWLRLQPLRREFFDDVEAGSVRGGIHRCNI
jgi:hypothetical protein